VAVVGRSSECTHTSGGVPSVCSIKVESKPSTRLDLVYVRESPRPYGTSAPRRRSQPVRIHRSGSSRSTGPASISSPAAMRSSPRRAVLENQVPAMVPAHSTRMSSRPCARPHAGDRSTVAVRAVWRLVGLRRGARRTGSGLQLTCLSVTGAADMAGVGMYSARR
jgi:hypothetical protein